MQTVSLSNLVIKQAATLMQPYFKLRKAAIRNLEQVVDGLRPGFARRARVLLSSALFLVLFLSLSLFTIPAAPAHAQTATLSPQQVVEYALTLEKLEDDFYRRAARATRNGRLRNAPQIVKDVIASYGSDETRHVADLSAVLISLGGNPDAITIPANPNYAAIIGRDPFSNLRDFLLALQYVEDLGVSAYKGQVQNLQASGNDTVLGGALEIHTIEARHAAGIRYLRQVLLNADIRPWIRRPNEVVYNENKQGFPIDFANQAFDGFSTENEVLALVGPILTSAPTSPAPTTRSAPSALEGSITQDDCPAGTTLELISGGYICRP